MGFIGNKNVLINTVIAGRPEMHKRGGFKSRLSHHSTLIARSIRDYTITLFDSLLNYYSCELSTSK